jgi:hypothetical protein
MSEAQCLSLVATVLPPGEPQDQMHHWLGERLVTASFQAQQKHSLIPLEELMAAIVAAYRGDPCEDEALPSGDSMTQRARRQDEDEELEEDDQDDDAGDLADELGYGEEQLETTGAHEEIAGPTASGRLKVSIHKAAGLQNLNMVGDVLWCQCDVKTDTDKSSGDPSLWTCKTKTLSGSLDPEWEEVHELSWYEGDALEFTIHDQGHDGSQNKGSVTVPSRSFYPDPFDGKLELHGQASGATLHVSIERIAYGAD